ncbi:ATP-dependent zinc metalloprotease FtsH [Leuconostoc gelidum]|uniref:ATP-dependent zinc metalloprotease FtsH n=1 Tax=Leuconostoc gelidum subsp. gelidum TaxID=1607839 RepID=A0AB35G1V3_LEUGE|nr:ATP-dependent zinc metalloprotease FtsH [Leuconostoc gelidum]AFS39871.1 cell division protease [Leuconostoc gelidum JB7]MBZ5964610.1 ATP-dependent zinc metalloprotease FtsH [Leuconostoc gelidum subsp. gelidum]MBZ5974785.1 ATP-dependent zinc metalloprotease FtsH [Leuconostoc gelidum subsp. gelidum]MBZ5977625.1 ATP-dependent zinc metalloprotease FtsH [Leuconostoc gelidum subsp. gelidum]MBZ5986437.1 ATP-dependent zinc metalloprotease FtsH [Leuconostoc gelidum subsp. gelidum]
MNNNQKGGFLKSSIFYVFIFLAVVGMIYGLFGNDKSTSKTLTSSEFLKALSDKDLKSITVQPGNGIYNISGEYRKAKTVKSDKGFSILQQSQKVTKFTSTVLPNDASLKSVTDTAKTTKTDLVTKQQESSGFWLNLLVSVVPIVLIVGVFYLMMSQAGGKGGQGGMMSFGKSKAKPSDPKDNKVRFSDVAGAEEEKQELVEVVEFLKSPKKFVSLGARIPKGVLLEGPPGTGKTLLAKAVAGEANVPFFSMSGSDFVEMFVGVGASRVRDLFENAKKSAPAIIFIDEIDAVGRRRGTGMGGGNDEREQTLNQILIEMDGFEGSEGVIILASTNRSDVLDPALLRSGRFDRKILIGAPDVKGREAILNVHAKNKPLADNVDLKAVAQQTPGYVGADLENLLNEAALLAARRNKKKVDAADIDEAEDRIFQGPAKTNRSMSERERRTTAYHEAGHALVGLIRSEASIVRKVTIVPRGRIGGYALMTPKTDRYNLRYSEAKEQLAGLMGGRAAELFMFNEASSGASNDFQQATGLTRQMVTAFGMSDKLGMVQLEGNASVGYGEQAGNRGYSEETARLIDEEVRRLSKEAFDDATKIISEHKDKLIAIAEALLEVETLDEKQIKDIYETGKFTRKDIQDNDELATAKSFDEAKAAVDAKDSEAEARFENHDEPEDDDHSEADHSSDSSNDDKVDENK